MSSLVLSTPSKSVSTLGRPNWKDTPYKSTPDEIIDAYKAGKKEGMSQQKRILLKEFDGNLSRACSLSEQLFNQLNKRFKNFSKNLFLKVNGVSDFEALLIVDRKSYISNSRIDAFTEARKLKKDNKEDLFSIDFSFLPESKNLDFKNIFYDGYSLKYEPRVKSKARKA